MERSVKAGKPFFHWHNTADARLDTPFAKWQDKSGFRPYADGMNLTGKWIFWLSQYVDGHGTTDTSVFEGIQLLLGRLRMSSEGYLAEGEGFEPPLPVKVKRFSRPPVSTAHTSLRVSVVNSLAALKNREKGHRRDFCSDSKFPDPRRQHL
jgi:hypothetical protein